jgi:type II secretory pathway pseudopilin PulG
MEEIMAKVQFRLRSLIIAIIIVALLLALGIQTIRVQRLQAREQQAVAAAMRARTMAELAAQRAQAQPAPQP